MPNAHAYDELSRARWSEVLDAEGVAAVEVRRVAQLLPFPFPPAVRRSSGGWAAFVVQCSMLVAEVWSPEAVTTVRAVSQVFFAKRFAKWFTTEVIILPGLSCFTFRAISC